MAANTDYTAEQLSHITRFAAGLLTTAREAIDIGLGDDSTDERLADYAYHAAPYFLSVAEMRSMTEQARTLSLDEARAAGHPNVLG